MTKWAVLFCCCTILAVMPVAAQSVVGGADTLELSFGWMGGRSGDTSYLYMGPPAETWPASPAYLEHYYDKHLQGIYHGDTAVSGVVIV